MTTNKPPIAAWAPSTALRKLESRHNNAPCILTDGPAEFNDVALVRLADYEALKAEFVIRLDEVSARNYELRMGLAEARANDQQAMAYLNEVRSIVGGDDFPDMVERVAKLRTILAQTREYVFEPDRDCKCQECVDATSLLCAIDAAMQRDNPC